MPFFEGSRTAFENMTTEKQAKLEAQFLAGKLHGKKTK
jgi:hypothetical protein